MATKSTVGKPVKIVTAYRVETIKGYSIWDQGIGYSWDGFAPGYHERWPYIQDVTAIQVAIPIDADLAENNYGQLLLFLAGEIRGYYASEAIACHLAVVQREE